ncbi:triosephosphate isomerase [Thermincola ferriacetica]|uniref:Triosephosphate isomerase n=2 Tax=Thermincola TaxID=278993 RepID=D5XC92_THEPJ|nr:MULTISPECIES: triose-phosphate isomerase [Thermincola]ADG83544.1 triosephosphate isomerase [Thermincola potens JR]KNZ70010.1 triosephosphate isomerase [Thermincola ferriacetica]
MRVPIIAGNWKMFKTVEEAIALVSELSKKVQDVEGVEIVVCPPFTALDAVNEVLNDSQIVTGAQNMFWAKEGAYTGEVSPVMIKNVGCKYVILGHSERREYFGETDETINKKIKSAFEHALIPILCVGEKLEQREAGLTEQVVRTQTEGALAGIPAGQVSQLVIAYEPVWAIGTGKTASDEDAQKVVAYIRKVIAELYEADTAQQVRILYGGSVKPENIAGLMKQPDIDGALVGGASLDAESFARIVRFKWR